MPKAMNTPTTPPARPAAKRITATPEPFPSVFDIVRHAKVARDARDRFEADRVALSNTEGEQRAVMASGELVAIDREQSLLNLALALPARTLGDVAAQLVATMPLVDDMEALDLSEAEIVSNVQRLRRIIASVLPVIVGAAGVDLAEIADVDMLEFFARRRPAMPGEI